MTTLENRPNTALLVIDVQNGVVSGAHERDTVVANIGSLVEKARRERVPVVWVQHNDAQLARGSEDWRIVPELTPDQAEPLVEKNYGDAFEDTTLEMPLFLPVAVAAISADSVAGEANLGTLRYLLSVPVDRTRLLVVKLGAITVFAFAATMVVAGVGALLGLAVFGAGPMVSLSGSQLPFWDGVLRLVLVCLYLTVCLTALGAIGMFVSTLTEQPIGAAVAILVLAVGSQIMDAIPQLSAIHAYLPTHYWLAFGDLLRDPIALDRTVPGLLSALAYVAIFGTAAWARFGGRDVTS